MFYQFKKDIFGSHAGTTSAGYRKLSNGSWTEDNNGQVNVAIDAVFLNDNCINPDTKDETEDCGSCYAKRTWVTKLLGRRSIANGNVQSSHTISFSNGSSFSKSLVLNPC